MNNWNRYMDTNDCLNVNEEYFKKNKLMFHSFSDLIEREDASNKLRSFIEILHKNKRGLLRIIGQKGSGRTSFLNKVVTTASKYRYDVISLNEYGYNKIRADAIDDMNISKTGRVDINSLESFMYNRKTSGKNTGIILIIDNINQITKETLILLSRLLEHKDNLILALVFSSEPGAVQNLDFIDIPINQTIHIEPLSPHGLCSWFKKVLDWEPPRHFIKWLYNKTMGNPKLIYEAVTFLLEDEVIKYYEEYGWSINKNYLSILLINKTKEIIDGPKNNLPASTLKFVGRDNEIEIVKNLVDKARLVTLIGPGGIGKTRLALEVASVSLCNYKDGVFWVPLVNVTEGNLLLSGIAKVLNISEVKEQNIFNNIKSVLQSKRMLLVLDNFEQIINEAPIVSQLLAASPGLCVVVTSREPLNIYGEHVYSVPPLGFIDSLEKVCVETIKNQHAVSLFLERAKVAQYDFTLTEENALQVLELCAILDGIPLAIELAAANIGQISIKTMLSGRKNRLNWLKNGSRDLHDRQHTLRNTIEWGYNLLNENQKRIFRRLGVFKGAFNLKASNKILNCKNDITNIREELMSLVKKSLIYIYGELKDGEYSLKMLETIREYAVELLSKSDEENYIKDCHSDYFISLAEEVETKINGTELHIWFDNMDAFYCDIMDALEHLKSTNCLEKTLKLTGAMGYYWEKRGFWNIGQSNFEHIIKRWDRSEYNQFFIKIFQWHGRLSDLQGNYQKAFEVYELGLMLIAQNSDPVQQAHIQHMMSCTARKVGNYKYGEELMQQSLCIYRKINNKYGMADVLQDLGQLYYFTGEYEKAENNLKESIEICRKPEDKFRISRALGMLSFVARVKGNFEQASDMSKEYLISCEELNDKPGIIDALMSIAEMARCSGDYERSKNYYLRALNFARELGYMSVTGRVLKELGEISRYKGDLKKAHDLFEESLTILSKNFEKGEEIWIYRNMAELELMQGNILKAEELFLKGIKVYQEIKINTPIYIFLIFEGLAGVSLLLGHFDRAACLFGAADKIYKTIENLIAKNDNTVYLNRYNELRQKINEKDFLRSWNEGNVMSIEHALDYAVGINNYNYDRAMAYKMINYIHENYNKDISLNDISGYFNMSSNYLSTMFKYYTGQRYKDYLNFYRVKIAKELLKSGGIKVNEVAKRVGCMSVVTFIRMFKKYEGISPGQYLCDQMEKYQP